MISHEITITINFVPFEWVNIMIAVFISHIMKTSKRKKRILTDE